MQKTRTKLFFTLALIVVTALCAAMATALGNSRSAEAETSYGYYYDQLESSESKAIYAALADMRDGDVLKTGTETWDLVGKGYLSNKEYDQTTLTAAFGAGRDAFMLDNADLFYIDFDKISLRSLTDGANYKITLGIGREDNYFADGFTASTVDKAITDFNAKVESIASSAAEYSVLSDKILSAYEAVMDSAVYALEFDAGEDADYVRCAYGVLVKGKGVCQSFSEALNVVLDKLNVTCVLVQGTFIDDNGDEQPHMWCHVLMDDNRWYILDATMDNALSDDGYAYGKYFLMNGTDAAGLYVPNGIISTSGFEFEYPALCMADYETPSSSFTIETATTENGTEYEIISYNGMGLRAAEKQGYYVIATYSVNEETNWFYVMKQIEIALANSDGSIDDYDHDTYFSGLLLSGSDYILAVTTDKYSDGTSLTDIYYNGSNIFDKSNAVVYDADERPPYALSVSPDCLRFYIGSSYNVTITFSGELKKIDASADVTVTFSVPEGVTLSSASTVISGIVWDESNPTQISFKFTPDKNYSADRCNYTFSFGNVVGTESGKVPTNVILTALYKPSFSCPMDPLSYCTAVATVPTLIADSDLSVEGWTYTDGDGNEQTVTSSSLSAKISLVATMYGDEKSGEYEDAVEAYNKAEGNDAAILKSATYDLSLNLCDVQVNYLNGNKVMVMVPFPDGYSAESAGVSFKAYHFSDSGAIEEIDCYCTEYGIILFCSSFSAYTVAAVEGADTAKKVLVTTEGNGSASSENFIEVEDGGKLSVTFTADNGYCVDCITVNGETLSGSAAEKYLLEKEYSELDANTTIIVKFASTAVVKAEMDGGFTLASAESQTGGLSTLTIVIIALVCLLVAAIAVEAVLLVLKYKRKKK